ncbi:helix-turn-helix transcriptional regulator [Escherichia coli]|uniref:helix-turn-helix transcriptional regulator n=1 Tax=Escherichia coli TaxID=562 RepID=UPI0030F4A000
MAPSPQPSDRKLQKPQKLIRLPEVVEITGRSRSRIYDDIKADIFPRPVRIGRRAVAWVEQEIIDWIEEKKQLRI